MDDEIRKLLLPREKYLEIYNRNNGECPTLEIENSKQKLFYFGANHSRDINDKQYTKIKIFWGKFLAETQTKDKVVLIEGQLRSLRTDESEAIHSSAEAGYITFLAHKENVDVESADLSEGVLAKLVNNVDREELLLYWFLVLVDNYRRFPDPKPNFEKYFENWKNAQDIKDIWKGQLISLPNLESSYLKILGKEFSISESQNHLIDPNISGTAINSIARMQSDLRDAYTVSRILEKWELGKSIFVVFGNGHLIIQEPALRSFLS